MWQDDVGHRKTTCSIDITNAHSGTGLLHLLMQRCALDFFSLLRLHEPVMQRVQLIRKRHSCSSQSDLPICDLEEDVRPAYPGSDELG